ncbi:MAG: hypothetical protein IJP11_02795 [Oscillospiraceae bacterium]|nr:hypothetical protein [Oscillospiraceae bacterium]
MKKEEKLPYVGDPTVQQIIGQPDSCWEMVNRWGTYEVQATQDTDNMFPAIAQGYPTEAKKHCEDPWHPNGC